MGFDGLFDLSPANGAFLLSVVYLSMREVELHRRCDRNRKRSKRRAIYCPIHGCYLDSVSQKYSLFANRTAPLQPGGLSRHNVLILVETETAVHLESQWLEAFWCDQCQETKWYHVQKSVSKEALQKVCTYDVSLAPPKIWQQAVGVIHPNGNPSVGEFIAEMQKGLTTKAARTSGLKVERCCSRQSVKYARLTSIHSSQTSPFPIHQYRSVIVHSKSFVWNPVNNTKHIG